MWKIYMRDVYNEDKQTHANSLTNDLDTLTRRYTLCLFVMLRDAIMNERDRTLYTLAVRRCYTYTLLFPTPTALAHSCTRKHMLVMCSVCVYACARIGSGWMDDVMCCPFVCARVYTIACVCVRCSGIGSRVNVGGAVYVHPIRILFYDRRVIMCAVMLNSTYLLWNVFCRYFIFESLINFTAGIFECGAAVAVALAIATYYSALKWILRDRSPLFDYISLCYNLIYLNFVWCRLFARVIWYGLKITFMCKIQLAMAKQKHSIANAFAWNGKINCRGRANTLIYLLIFVCILWAYFLGMDAIVWRANCAILMGNSHNSGKRPTWTLLRKYYCTAIILMCAPDSGHTHTGHGDGNKNMSVCARACDSDRQKATHAHTSNLAPLYG